MFARPLKRGSRNAAKGRAVARRIDRKRSRGPPHLVRVSQLDIGLGHLQRLLRGLSVFVIEGMRPHTEVNGDGQASSKPHNRKRGPPDPGYPVRRPTSLPPVPRAGHSFPLPRPFIGQRKNRTVGRGVKRVRGVCRETFAAALTSAPSADSKPSQQIPQRKK